MATLVDALGILKTLGFYDTVFPFILVFALLYGFLMKFQPFGENKTINSVVAAVIGLIFISISRASTFLINLIPLLTAFFLIILFLMLIFIFMGVKGETIAKVITGEPAGYGAIMLIFVLLVLVVFGQTFPEQAILTQQPGVAKELNISLVPPGATPTETAAALLSAQQTAIIFSPQVLSLAIILLIFGLATYFITRETGSGKG